MDKLSVEVFTSKEMIKRESTQVFEATITKTISPSVYVVKTKDSRTIANVTGLTGLRTGQTVVVARISGVSNNLYSIVSLGYTGAGSVKTVRV